MWVERHGDAFADIFCGAYWDTDTNIAWDVKRNFKTSYRYGYF